MQPSDSTSLFSNYLVDRVHYDEMIQPNGHPRTHCKKLYGALNKSGIQDLRLLQERAERFFLHEGITFAVYDEDGAQERIIPIDLLPRIIAANDWQMLDRGLRQRLKAMNRFLGDIYGPNRSLTYGDLSI